jgi:hypothetical protein
MKITFEVDGRVKFIYDDTAAEVAKEVGPLTIKRASHVEPDENGFWWADMEPVSGPQLGPFTLREQALAAERTWLLYNNIPRPK